MQVIPISADYFTSHVEGDTAHLTHSRPVSVGGVLFSYPLSMLQHKKPGNDLVLELAALMLSRDIANEKYR